MMTSHNQLSRKSKSHLQGALLSGIISPSWRSPFGEIPLLVFLLPIFSWRQVHFRFLWPTREVPFFPYYRVVVMLFPQFSAALTSSPFHVPRATTCQLANKIEAQPFAIDCYFVLKFFRELFGIVLPQQNMCCLRCLFDGCFFMSRFQVTESYFGFKLD